MLVIQRYNCQKIIDYATFILTSGYFVRRIHFRKRNTKHATDSVYIFSILPSHAPKSFFTSTLNTTKKILSSFVVPPVFSSLYFLCVGIGQCGHSLYLLHKCGWYALCWLSLSIYFEIY